MGEMKPAPADASRVVPSEEQLVVELFVRDLDVSRQFYAGLGFSVLYESPGFCAVAWEGHRLFLDARPLPPDEHTRMNVRIMVADVDRYWAMARERKLTVLAPIADRAYGLRDFTIADPDGFGLRFGTRIPRQSAGA